jgi:hypothetical protein
MFSSGFIGFYVEGYTFRFRYNRRLRFQLSSFLLEKCIVLPYTLADWMTLVMHAPTNCAGAATEAHAGVDLMVLAVDAPKSQEGGCLDGFDSGCFEDFDEG